MMHDFVGFRAVEVDDDVLGIAFPMVVFYPTNQPEKTENIGPFQLQVALNAPVKAGVFPVVLISHGSGGTPLVYRTLAHYLARSGFVVGLPEHPFNNRNDNTWQGTAQNLAARPRHLRLAIDSLYNSPRLVDFVLPDVVGLVGHSMGGYTALALAGGTPTCFPAEAPDGQPHSVTTEPDRRVRAVVLLAPAAVWFRAPNALRDVQVPLLMLLAEIDELTPVFHAQVVLDGLPTQTRIEHRVVPNAGHFSFLSPFPVAMTSPGFPPSQDPPGFDRARFHDELNTQVKAFLQRELGAGSSLGPMETTLAGNSRT